MVHKLINKFKRKGFARNVLMLISGTTVAQGLMVLASPIITRLYSPEQFGVFSLYFSICIVLGAIACGRYEMSILLPKKSERAKNIVVLAMTVAIIFSLLLAVIFFFFSNIVIHLLKEPMVQPLLYLVPFAVCFIGLYNGFYYWNNRVKRYKQIVKSKVSQSIFTIFFQVLFGFLDWGPVGLAIGYLIGQVTAILILFQDVFKNVFQSKDVLSREQVFKLAKRYKNFPKYLMLAHLMNALSVQIPVILLSMLYSASDTGYYALTIRAIGVPMAVVGTAMGDVFRQKAAEDFNQHGHCRPLYLKTFKVLLLLSCVPFVILFFIAPDLFAWVFGYKWLMAGYFARYMTAMFFLQFITVPLSAMFLVSENQRLDLLWQILRLILSAASVYLGFLYFHSSRMSVILFSAAFVCLYIINGMMTYHMSKGRGGIVVS